MTGGKIGKLYDVYDEAGGVNVRGRFLIDPQGIIQAAEILSPPVGRNPQELLRQIQAYQHNQATGEVMPSGWVPGESTLKPSTDLPGMYGRFGNLRNKTALAAKGAGPKPKFRPGPAFRHNTYQRVRRGDLRSPARSAHENTVVNTAGGQRPPLQVSAAFLQNADASP